MTDEPTEIDANQSADPIGTVVPDSDELPAMLDAIPSNVVDREYAWRLLDLILACARTGAAVRR